MTRKAQFLLQRRETTGKGKPNGWWGRSQTYSPWVTLSKTDEFPDHLPTKGLYQWRIMLRGVKVAENLGDSYGWRIDTEYQTAPQA